MFRRMDQRFPGSLRRAGSGRTGRRASGTTRTESDIASPHAGSVSKT